MKRLPKNGPHRFPEMERALEQLKGYDPENVILFGSATREDTDEYSDIDLIVIKETDRRFVNIHSVRELALQCTQEDLDFSPFGYYGLVLDRYYLATRYPDALPDPAVPFESFTAQEAQQALDYAGEIVELVRSKIPHDSAK